jgi:hypothetical protein
VACEKWHVYELKERVQGLSGAWVARASILGTVTWGGGGRGPEIKTTFQFVKGPGCH